MNYRGIIIEESLTDKRVLDGLHIIATKLEPVTPAHQTPWLKQWTLHTIEVPETHAAPLAERLSRALEAHDQGGSSWYIDYKTIDTHYIIFPNKVFRINRAHPEQYRLAVEYGLHLGIPEHQLTFSPEVEL